MQHKQALQQNKGRKHRHAAGLIPSPDGEVFGSIVSSNKTFKHMKKLLRHQERWPAIRIMRILSIQSFLVLTLASFAWAHDLKGQGILDKEISVEFQQTSLKKALLRIEQIAGVKFAYSPSLIAEGQKVSIRASNQKLAALLDELLTPLNISYKLIADRISLYRALDQSSLKVDSDHHSANTESLILTVSGTVVDENGQTLPGVNVIEKGTLNGSTTDADGKFSLTVQDEQSVLVFSFIGYVTQEVPLNGRLLIDVSMVQDVQRLDEVVVVGYGTQKKVNLTGAVANVDFEDISNRPITNSINALAGTMPGLSIIQGGGQPGNEQTSILIRGMGSVNADANPLIIIDGSTSSMESFADLNPNDIKEISILKDASSSAIYGSRAANGVILITTKKGLNDEGVQINLNVYRGVQQATVLPEMLSAWDGAMMENEARANSGMPIFFTDDQIELMKNGDPSDGFHNTNWVDEVFRPAPMQNYSLSVRTGGKKLRNYSSLNYYEQEGIIRNSNSSRFNVRSKFDLSLNEHIDVGLNLSAVSQNIHQPFEPIGESDRAITGAVYGTPRAAPIYYNNGDYFTTFHDVLGYQQLWNPVQSIESGYRDGSNKRLTSILTGAFNWKDFRFNSLISYDYSVGKRRAYRPRVMSYDNLGVQTADNQFAELTEEFFDTEDLQVDNYLSYAHEFQGNHFLSILVGHSFLDNKRAGFQAFGRDMPSNFLQVLGASNPDSQRADGSNSRNTLQSFFGRINYSYKERYLFEANIRRDGSSRFHSEHRYGTFPSLSLGWRVSEENFLAQNSFIDDLKVRASWGVLGNQGIGDYAYASGYSVGTPYLVNGELVNGAAITTLANERIRWEETTTSNLGIDLTLFERFDLTYDYFLKQTENMLVRLPIPLTLGGLGAPYQNIGEMQNKGWELSLRYAGPPKAFKYSFNFNLSQVKNEVVDLNDQIFYPTDQLIIEGAQMYSWFGYKAEGIFQNDQEIAGAASQTPAARPGDLKFKDISGINGQPDGKIDSYDRTIIGKSIPETYYGFGGNASYKSVDFNVFFQGVADVSVNTYSRVNHASTGGNPQSWSVEWLNRWTPENPGNEYPRIDHSARRGNDQFSSYYLEDGSYLRLKNIELGYSLPSSTLNKLGIERMRIYIGGQNLLTFTKVKHFDPERARSAVRTEFYPQIKIYQLGLNVTL